MSNNIKVLLASIVSLLFITSVTIAQTKEIQINWKGTEKVYIGNGNDIDLPFGDQILYTQSANYLPAYHFDFSAYVTDIKLSNLVYEPISNFSANISNPKKSYWISQGLQNGRWKSSIEILALRQNPNTQAWERLSKFNYEIVTGNTPQERTQTSSFPASSVLETGDWYKLAIVKDGIYKLDHTYLQNLGINLSSINPKNIAIYGNGGAMLPQANSTDRNMDLVENAIYVAGEDDNTFDQSDYILFNGQSTTIWNFDNNNQVFKHVNNIYADTSYYFLTIKTTSGLRIQNIQNTLDNNISLLNTFDERAVHENDIKNLQTSGRTWFGEVLNAYNNYTETISINLPGLSSDSILKIRSVVLGKSIAATTSTVSFDLKLNNFAIGTQTVNAVGSNYYAVAGVISDQIFTPNLSTLGNTGSISASYKYNRGLESSAIGYIDFLEINAKRKLSLYNGVVSFRNIYSSTLAQSGYAIKGMSNTSFIWDITNPLIPKSYTFNLSSDTAKFNYSTNFEIKEFIAFNLSGTLSPISSSKINNQNLLGLSPTNLIIITHPKFNSQAEEIKDIRTKEGLSAQVVEVDKIYNEFSSGKQDITAIRDFIRSVYLKSSSSKDSLKYVLLIGSCSYDYKNRLANNSNLIPIYESVESLDPILSHSSDDFFGFMDLNEGNWGESPLENNYLDVAIGRIPASSTEQINDVLNKFKQYSDNTKTFDSWKNRIVFIADDGKDANEGNLHLNQAETLTTNLEKINQSINIEKIYTSTYPFVTLPDGIKAPGVNSAINEVIEKGSLLINYTGHGGETGLSSKGIVTLDQINSWKNINRLSFWATATCEFGRYDDPSKLSAGMQVLLTPNGAGIGLVTTTRPVYSSSNAIINQAFYNVVFKKVNGEYPRIGDVVKYSKNNAISGVVNRNYALLGDPSMRLNYPENNIAITKINGKTWPGSVDTLKALSNVTMEGQVSDIHNVLMSDFNGKVQVTVYDKKSSIRTLGQNGIPSTSYQNLFNIVYSGLATVKNGVFSINFVVPKDISYNIGSGKISLYAQADDFSSDAAGYENTIKVGSSDTSTSASNDNTPPILHLFMNDTTFVNGGTTDDTPIFLAKLSDDNGINITGTGIGHELTAVIDGDEKNILILNKYYISEKDNFRKGTIQHQLPSLSAGNHTIKLKVWDSNNNSAESTLEFVVRNPDKLAVDHLLNYPNPFTTNTTFHFDHNRAGDDLDVQIQIFTVSGRLIKTLNTTLNASNSHFSDLSWNGKDDFEDNIGKGVYVYKLLVKSKNDSSSLTQYQKLVILN